MSGNMVRSVIFAASLLYAITITQSKSVSFIPKNDWSKPCFNGECSWDHPVSNTGKNAGSSGRMKIWGSPDAISDVTEAGGWMILDCDKDKWDQDIRLVCKSNDKAEAGCDHLFQNESPEGKIIRLPNSCGMMPFARVSKQWVHEDQSIPEESMKKIARRDEAAPQVHALRIDTNFAAADNKKTGNVNLAIKGVNFPTTEPVDSTGPQRRSRLADRGFDPLAFFGDALSGNVKGVADAIHGIKQFDERHNKTFEPIDVNQNFPIFSGTIECPAKPPKPSFSASLNADLDTKAHAVVAVGVVAVGAFFPPKIDEFSLFAGLNADLNAALHVAAKASGEVTSGPQTLFEIGVPGLDFPGIFSLGPSFKINGEVKAALDLDLDMTVNLAYSVRDAQLVFPPNDQRKSGGEFKPADSNIQLSATPSVSAKGTLEGHIIPTVDFGLSALGVVEAKVFLDLDAAAILGLQLNASADVAGGTGEDTTVKGASVDGCFDVSAGLDVGAGAKGSFFGLFDGTTRVSLFAKKFELFKKCFGSQSKPNPDDEAPLNAVTNIKTTFVPATQFEPNVGTVSAAPTTSPADSEDSPSTADSTSPTADSPSPTADSEPPTEESPFSAEDSEALAERSVRHALRNSTAKRVLHNSLQVPALRKRALGCGVQTLGGPLASLAGEVINAAGIKPL